MQNDVLVSIIVPCYKQAHYLEQSLQSVLDQTYSNWECIIVNDGSPDDTSAVAQYWEKRDSRFKLLEKENGGLSSARNAGINSSKGTFILPLDADDILSPKYLESTVPELEKRENVAIVGSYSKFFRANINNIVNEHIPKGNYYKWLLYTNQLVATSLYRKDLWEEIGGYDESMKKGFEDWEFWLNITKHGWNYYIVPEYLFYYRKAQKSMLVATIAQDAEMVKKYIALKHKELYVDDFDNFVEVFTYNLFTSRRKEQRLQNSLEFKIGKAILKPWRLLGKLIKK